MGQHTIGNNNFSALRIIYWNARSIAQRKEELEQMLQEIDIFICVETWLKPEMRIAFKGFNTVRKDRIGRRGGGIAIFIKRSIDYCILPNIRSFNNLIETCSIKLVNTVPSINIMALYRPQGPSLGQNKWDWIMQTVSDLQPCLLVGDFNAHNTVWNCSSNDCNGDRLFNSLLSHSIFLHNPDSLTHVDLSNNSKSNIDLIFTTPDLADKTRINTLDDTHGSDHFPIGIEISIEKTRHIYRKVTNTLSSSRTDWDKYQELMAQNFQLFLSREFNILDCVEKYNFFTDYIREAIIKNTPSKVTVNDNIHRNPVPWWDKECERVKRLRRAAYKKWQHTYEMSDLSLTLKGAVNTSGIPAKN
ncbi:uncharacterized protein LOC143354605 [Halictus rubicundus]|uniref:uncharacterized protein LOC143354605 n=1 Tax=Halictus rubicundus TaxID=77578 RepID=UPI004036169F